MRPTIELSTEEINRGFATIRNKTENLKRLIKNHVGQTTLSIHKTMQAKLAADKTNMDGRLRNSLTFRTDLNGGLTGMIETKLFYAPYVEFGTKRRAGKISPRKGGGQIDPELMKIAAQYKGGTGKKGLEEAIREWAKKRQIDPEVVGAIYVSIARHGTYASPFFFNSVALHREKYLRRLENIIKKHSDK